MCANVGQLCKWRNNSINEKAGKKIVANNNGEQKNHIDRKMSDEMLKTKYEIQIDRIRYDSDFNTFPQSNRFMHYLQIII